VIAEFYLLNQSFRHDESLSLNDLEERIKDFAEDYAFIRRYKETDKLYLHSSIYSELIYQNISIADLLYSGKGKNLFNRDTKEFLRRIIETSELQDMTLEEVIEVLLELHNPENVFGLLCLLKIRFFEEKYLVYNKNDWFAFHRYFLGLYPISESHFYSECQKYFPNLFFHERVQETLKTLEKGLKGFSKSIVHHLTLLNDEFHKYYDPSNRIDTLKKFSSACGVEASPQGSAKDKPKMTFEFINDSNVKEQLCCEPHLKLGQSDESGDSHYYFNRIYFHEGKENIANGRILIGHIGGHIKFDR
jgi:hypothetical protein